MPKPKVLLIGWDAADWKVITPLVDAGKMPNVARIIENGVMGNLATLYPILSPMLWTSIATGKRPFKHGIHGFSEPDPNDGGIRPITNLSRTTKAIWNILNQNGLRSNIIGWWPSHPAEPINGVMVSNHFQQKAGPHGKPWPMRPGTIHPPELMEILRDCRVHPEELPGDALQMFVPDADKINQEKDRRLYQLAKVIAECSGIQAAATSLINDHPWDFMAVYFDGIDHLGHGFMGYHPPKPDWVGQKDFELYQHVIEGGYRYHDYMLGVLLELAWDDTTVILMSDHGFHPDALRPKEIPNEPAGPAAEHRPFGIFAAAGPGVKKDDLLFGAGLLDICPTILTLFGLPVGEDMDGRPLTSIFETDPKPEYIPSWDAVEGNDGRHPPDTQIDAVESQEAINQLVALGYIEEPDADKEKAVADTVRELRYNLARSYTDASRHHEAMAVFHDLWETWPGESRFGVHLFQCLLAIGQNDAAAEVLDEVKKNKLQYALAAREELEALTVEWKKADKKKEDLDRKEQVKLRKLRARAGTNQHAFAYLEGSLLHSQGRHEEAIDMLRKAEDVQMASQPSLRQTLGEACLALKKYDEAEAEFHRALKTDAINPHARLGLAKTHLGRSEYENAAAQALAAAGQCYHNPSAHFIAGFAMARAERVNEAVVSLKTALSQNPVYPDAHLELARIYQDVLGDWPRAAEHRDLARKARIRIKDWKAGERDEKPKREVAVAFSPSRSGVANSKDLLFEDNEDPGRDAGLAANESVVVVSGLPRSGTSMMMQMLSAGGFPVLTDEKRKADESNERGYLEYEPVKTLGRDNSWLVDAKGHAVKIIAQLLPRLPLQARRGTDKDSPPEKLGYRVILMRRPLGEIVSSQNRMLERLGREGGRISGDQLAKIYRKQVAQVRHLLAHYRQSGRVAVLPVDYHDALAKPAKIAAQVNDFLGDTLDEEAMAQTIDAGMRREKNKE